MDRAVARACLLYECDAVALRIFRLEWSGSFRELFGIGLLLVRRMCQESLESPKKPGDDGNSLQ